MAYLFDIGIPFRKWEIMLRRPDLSNHLIIAFAIVNIGSTLPSILQADWPNWMGPKHNGISGESIPAANWPEEGLSIAWSKDIGIGFSSISIGDGRLFTMGHTDGKEIVYCLDAKTGKTVWTHSYPGKLVDSLHEGGPGSTPAVHGELVYTLGKEGQFFCLKVSDGSVVWQKQLMKDLEVRLPEWGFTSSPCILGDKVILEAGRVVAYDKNTGRKIWQTERHTAGYGSARAFEHDGQTLLATLDCDGLRVVKAENGKQVAFASWRSPYRTNSTTPIIVGDTIFISTGYNIGCALFRLKDSQLETIYKNKEMRNHFNNSILLDGYLYGFDGNSNLGRVVQVTCMDHKTGKVMWKQRGYGCGSLMVADDKLLILSDKGTLAIAKATPRQFDEEKSAKILSGRCWTVPILLDGKVYARNARGQLVCVRLPGS